MPARTGAQFIAGLRENPPNIYINGEKVKDVTTYPGFRNGIDTIARLYDMQHDPALRDEMTYVSPTTGDRVANPPCPVPAIPGARRDSIRTPSCGETRLSPRQTWCAWTPHRR